MFIEPTQYRSDKFPEYWLVGNEADRLWVAGIPIKIRTHDGLTHMKTLITSRSALLASSNYTKNWQRDHNYFIPLATKPTLYGQMKNEFNRMWNDTANYTNFKPLPPQPVTLVAPGAGAGQRIDLADTDLESRALGRRLRCLSRHQPEQHDGHRARRRSTQRGFRLRPTRTQSIRRCSQIRPTIGRSSHAPSRPMSTRRSSHAPSTLSFTTGTGSGGGSSGPFSGTPVSLPGTIQAENYDTGGSAVAYSDSTSGNSGGAYRNDNVDIESTTDTGGGYDVGWIAPGRVVEIHGERDSCRHLQHRRTRGLLRRRRDVPRRSQWRRPDRADDHPQYRRVAVLDHDHQVGCQPLGRHSGVAGRVRFDRTVRSRRQPQFHSSDRWQRWRFVDPYGGTPAAVPGTVQAENFDDGGSGIAWLDTSVTNDGGQYRSTNVDVETTSDAGGGYDVG